MSETDTAGNPIYRTPAHCGLCGGATDTGGLCVSRCVKPMTAPARAALERLRHSAGSECALHGGVRTMVASADLRALLADHDIAEAKLAEAMEGVEHWRAFYEETRGKARGGGEVSEPFEGGPKRKEYEPKGKNQRLGYFVEECGEVLAAVGKTLRWGLDGGNPELPEAERETNREWIKRELADLKAAIKRLEVILGDDEAREVERG